MPYGPLSSATSCGALVCLLLWLLLLSTYFERLTLYKLPPRAVIVSCFLPLGPLGQGAFAIMQLGKVSMQLLSRTGTLAPLAGQILYVVGFFVAWFFFAIASISHSKFPFNMGWWGFTFPIGVFTVATTTLGKEMPSRLFDILGTVRGQQGL